MESPSSSENLFLINSVFSSPIFFAIGPDPFPSLKNIYPSPGWPSSIAHLFILSQKALDPPVLEGIAHTFIFSFLEIWSAKILKPESTKTSVISSSSISTLRSGLSVPYF